MNILVTGGAGFIGHHLIKKLLNENYDVTSIDNYSTGKKSNEVSGCEYINLNLANQSHNLINNQYSMCFHLAALSRVQPSFINPAKSIKNNYLSTLNIADFCNNHNIPLVYAGSSSIHYSPLGSPYAYSKSAGEKLLSMYSKSFKLNCCTARFYNVYGRNQMENGDYATLMGIFEKQYREKKPFTVVGDGKQKRDFIYVGDIVSALISLGHYLADEKRFNTVFELGTGENYSINEIAKMFGENYPIKYIDSRPGEYPETKADYSMAYDILNWKPKIKLDKYIECIL